ncbi:MAG: hydantoinase/oxoprolinase family protein, partial [Cyanobium sp.]
EQHRPEIFALRIERPPPLPHRVLEVPGRLAADGSELEPFVRDPLLEEQLIAAHREGLRSCGVALLHAVSQPAHELALGAWLAELGFTPVLLSHRVGGLPRLLPRLQTTLVEAAVRPVLLRYLDQVQCALGPATRLRVMGSSGVLQTPEALHAKDTCLSGPAGGLVGAVAVARAAGLGGRPILGFDMGGTSTDVFHLEAADGDAERSPETLVAGLRLQALSLPIHTVAAGGGSVLAFEGGRLQVGPASAGALPGPACYRQGGPLTITDANLLLGRLPPQALPEVFGPGGDQGADGAVVRRGFEVLAAQLNGAGLESLAGQGDGASTDASADRRCFTPESLAHGARSIAIERMAEAIRRISIQRGHAISEAVLVSYGGAGGQHACALAERLGVRRVLLHPLAGVLSAYGIGLSRQQALCSEAVQRPLLPEELPALIVLRGALLRAAERALQAAGDGMGDRPASRVVLELRLQGGERGLELPWAEGEGVEALREAFERRHQERYGYVVAGEALVVERLQVILPAQAQAQEGLASQRQGEGGQVSVGLAEVVGGCLLSGGGGEQGAAVEASDGGSDGSEGGVGDGGSDGREGGDGDGGCGGGDGDDERHGGGSRGGDGGATAAQPLPTPQWLPLCLPVRPETDALVGEAPSTTLPGAAETSAWRRRQQPASPVVAPEAAVVAMPQPAASTGDDEAGGLHSDPGASPGDLAGAMFGERLQWRQVPCWRREDLRPGQRLLGPAVLMEATGTTVLEPGWGGRVLADGALLLEPLEAEIPETEANAITEPKAMTVANAVANASADADGSQTVLASQQDAAAAGGRPPVVAAAQTPAAVPSDQASAEVALLDHPAEADTPALSFE